jgi:hypothetical protein
MRSGIESKKNRVTGLLFNIDIASALTFGVKTLHFHNAVHRFALVLCMPLFVIFPLNSKKAISSFIHWWLERKATYQSRFSF